MANQIRSSKLFASEEEVALFCQKHDLIYLGLFGSQVRGEATDSSDIDFLYEFHPRVSKSLFDVGRMQVELEEKFQRDVDLVRKSKIKPQLQSYILNEVAVLYDKK